MKTTNQEYQAMAKTKSPHTKVLFRCVAAFLVGGAICTLGQLITQLCLHWGLSEDVSRPIASVSLVLFSAVCTAFRCYDNIAKFAGAGTLVPITGFANSVVSAAMEYKSEGWILGVGAKIFTIAGPVIVYGTVASVVYGVIYWVTTML